MRYLTILALLLTGCASQIKVVKTQPNEVAIAPKFYINKNNKVIMYVPEVGKFFNIKEK